jgi:hypothetical protein
MEYTKVKLKSEWLGHPKGSELELNIPTAQSLIARGAAVEVKGKPAKAENKMIERPVRSKRKRV